MATVKYGRVEGLDVRTKTIDDGDNVIIPKLIAHGYLPIELDKPTPEWSQNVSFDSYDTTTYPGVKIVEKWVLSFKNTETIQNLLRQRQFVGLASFDNMDLFGLLSEMWAAGVKNNAWSITDLSPLNQRLINIMSNSFGNAKKLKLDDTRKHKYKNVEGDT